MASRARAHSSCARRGWGGAVSQLPAPGLGDGVASSRALNLNLRPRVSPKQLQREPKTDRPPGGNGSLRAQPQEPEAQRGGCPSQHVGPAAKTPAAAGLCPGGLADSGSPVGGSPLGSPPTQEPPSETPAPAPRLGVPVSPAPSSSPGGQQADGWRRPWQEAGTALSRAALSAAPGETRPHVKPGCQRGMTEHTRPAEAADGLFL